MDKSVISVVLKSVDKSVAPDTKKKRLYLGEHLDEEVIRIIEERFECGLPCFQGHAGAYDPLDAMRRDAYREVCLWLRRELQLYRKETAD